MAVTEREIGEIKARLLTIEEELHRVRMWAHDARGQLMGLKLALDVLSAKVDLLKQDVGRVGVDTQSAIDELERIIDGLDTRLQELITTVTAKTSVYDNERTTVSSFVKPVIVALLVAGALAAVGLLIWVAQQKGIGLVGP